jgi:hypothetical protein
MSKGCGASLKIPDYVAHGKKVVATPHAVRGYESLEPWIAKAELDNYCDLFGELIEPGMQAFQKDCQDAYRWVARRLDWGMTCQTVVDSIGRS